MRNAWNVPATFVVCLLGLVGVPLLLSQKGSDDVAATITRLEDEGNKADLAHDTSFAKKYLADDYILGDSFVVWRTKAEVLQDHEATMNKVTRSMLSDMKVNAYGDTAIARYVDTYDNIYRGEHRSRKVICTDTWVKQSGTWKIVASHCSQTK